MNREELKKELVKDEGLKLKAYKDHLGVWTLAVGHNIEDRPISERAAMVILDDDIAAVEADLDRSLPWWRQLSEVRQRVLANWCFQLGITRLLGFAKALGAIKEGDFEQAEREMLSSRWAMQTENRARRMASLMRNG
jgi:lysozyme